MNGPDICVQCAAAGPTCCRIPPGQEDSCFPLSQVEQQRLQPHQAAASGQLFAQSPNTKFFLRHMLRLFPQDAATLDRLFPVNRAHRRLGLTSDGSCVFLGPSGCVVPVEDRPHYCRLYPFWFVGRRLTGFASPTCLAIQGKATPEGMFTLFNATRPALWEVYARLRMDWGLSNLAERSNVNQNFKRLKTLPGNPGTSVY